MKIHSWSSASIASDSGGHYFQEQHRLHQGVVLQHPHFLGLQEEKDPFMVLQHRINQRVGIRKLQVEPLENEKHRSRLLRQSWKIRRYTPEQFPKHILDGQNPKNNSLQMWP